MQVTTKDPPKSSNEKKPKKRNERQRERTGPNLNDRYLCPVGEDDTHLQQNPESVSDVIGTELLEALGTVTTLKQKGFTQCGLSQPLLEVAGLAGEHDGREGLEGAEDQPELFRVRVVRELEGLLGRP